MLWLILCSIQRQVKPSDFSVREDLQWILLKQKSPHREEEKDWTDVENPHHKYFLYHLCKNCNRDGKFLNDSEAPIQLQVSLSGLNTQSQWHLGVHDLTFNRKWKYSCIWEIKMGQKTKVYQQHRFFLRIFFLTYFDHWKLKYGYWHYCILWNLGMCLH